MNKASFESQLYDTFAVLIFDESNDIMGLNFMGENQTRNSKMISIPCLRDVTYLNGEHLVVSFPKEKTRFPSDTSLPDGEPSVLDLKILNR